jgi:MYXO-CTERM domain-containing protein
MLRARKFVWGAVVASCLVAAPLVMESRAQNEPARPMTTERENTDWGWLGLLGLAGLAGLMRKPSNYRVESGSALGAR